MQVINSINELRAAVKDWRSFGERIAFVPTMGNLHAGHLKLVYAAKQDAQRVIVSIFVNPTQFGPGEDFAAYPRTEAEDRQKLLDADIDALFLPGEAEMYGENSQTVISVKGLSNLHCGAFRPGHFDGVATVVGKLFNLVQPDAAFFGQKDFQQLMIIRTMVNDLNFPVEIKSVATEREVDGLAMSSRNGYLIGEQRKTAAKLYQALCKARADVLMGNKSYATIENEALSFLQSAGFKPDYFNICNADDLQQADNKDVNLVILTAARLANTRLIDNIAFSKTRTGCCNY
ncbi:MAG: pantoate--beta-alanine ligase [Gammaproteobacteria bacterium]|nr:pantoate--beta-alanine ligase [Gammaproteobacteria bacterium]